MTVSIWTIILIAGISDFLVFLISTILLKNKRSVNALELYATPIAAGALLSAAFIDFLGEGVEQFNAQLVLVFALAGVLIFFVLEGWLHWFHHHNKQKIEPKHFHSQFSNPVVMLATGGNWLHNFIDGAAIAAAFLVSPTTGIITTFAVALHEVPREIADSGYLLKRGLSVNGVIGVHAIAILTTALGVAVFYNLGDNSHDLLGALIGFTAGFFIYIASSDIIPSINQQRNKQKIMDLQTGLVLFGAIFVSLVIIMTHHLLG